MDPLLPLQGLTGIRQPQHGGHQKWRLSNGLIVRGLKRRSGVLRFGSQEVSTPSKMQGLSFILYILISQSNLTQTSHLS